MRQFSGESPDKLGISRKRLSSIFSGNESCTGAQTVSISGKLILPTLSPLVSQGYKSNAFAFHSAFLLQLGWQELSLCYLLTGLADHFPKFRHLILEYQYNFNHELVNWRRWCENRKSIIERDTCRGIYYRAYTTDTVSILAFSIFYYLSSPQFA